MNVVDLSSFTLTANLTLNGPPGTQFVFNINGNFNLHSGNITVAGGMSPMDVINITSPSASVGTMVPTTAVGILLAYYNKINAMDSSHFYGEIIGGYNRVITLLSGTKVTLPPQVTNAATALVNNVVVATTTATVYIEF